MTWFLLLATVVTAPSTPRFTGAGARFVPTSGQAARWVVGADPGVATSVENALFRGFGIAGELPSPVVNAIRPPAEVPDSEVQWWRETASPNTPELAPMMTLRSVTPAGVRLHARTGANGLVFRPGLLELPADVTPGSSWEGAGVAYDGITETDYRNTGTAALPADADHRDRGCLTVTSVTERRGMSRTDEATWCPEAGIVTGTPTLADPVVEADADRWPWAARVEPPEQWPVLGHVATARLVEGDPAFGLVATAASFHVQHPPVVTSGGTLVSIDATGTLKAWLRRDGDLAAVWWGHPGGTVLSLTALDNIVIATTSDKRLVAYDQNGRRLWSRQTPDLVLAPAVGVGRDRVVVGTLTGAVVAFDLESGRRLWSAEAPGGTADSPTVLGDLVVIRTKDRALVGIAPDGTVRWTSDQLDTGVAGLARAGDSILAVSPEGATYFLDAETGQLPRTGVTGFGKSHTALLAGPAGTAALTSADGVRILEIATARERRFVPGATVAYATETDWRVLTPSALLTVDPSGRDVAQLPLDPGVAGARSLTPAAGRLWIVTNEGVAWIN
ncbi:PQQ-binding-like beta-propeller repeat protein [Ammonicoccus fulvus]|uniref:PQQ-binding-like beta-propeller repeat protein n=1 Tax=Ammonicoccus fulvus TaxID=3138240 RepID=A0ABZ3FX44_9ACTN